MINYEIKHPKKLKTFFNKEASLIERSPLTFYKGGFNIMTILNFISLL